MEESWVVLEIQTAEDGKVSTIATPFADQMEAESEYHRVLTYAAVSTLPRHAASLLSTEGTLVESRCYAH